MESIKDEGLNDLLREIDEMETKCLEAISRLRKQRSELTGEDLVEFTVGTIHKDRIGLILSKIEKVDRTQSYNKLKDQWRTTAKAKNGWWLGEVSASGPKEKLLSVMHKIAKEGGTIIVDPVHKIDVPAPNKWWDYELQALMDEGMTLEEAEKAKAEAFGNTDDVNR